VCGIESKLLKRRNSDDLIEEKEIAYGEKRRGWVMRIKQCVTLWRRDREWKLSYGVRVWFLSTK